MALLTPYDRAGPPAQTNTDNLTPQRRLHHRAKTFGGWKNRRLPTGAIEWTSPHGYRFHVDPPAPTRCWRIIQADDGWDGAIRWMKDSAV